MGSILTCMLLTSDGNNVVDSSTAATEYLMGRLCIEASEERNAINLDLSSAQVSLVCMAQKQLFGLGQ